MPFNPKSKENLIRYKPGQSGNPKGRKRKLLGSVNAALKAEGFEPVIAMDVVEAYNTLMNLTESRIKEIIADSESPMFLRIVAKAMLSKEGVEMIEKMLDRAHGKAVTKVAATDKDGNDVPVQIIKLPDNNRSE